MVYLGNFVLIAAVLAAAGVLVFFIVRLRGDRYKSEDLKVPYQSLYVLFGLISLAILILLYGFITNNYDFDYVVRNSSSNMSVWYRMSALWAGHEGSFLFWIWLLSGFTAILAVIRYKYLDKLTSYALGILTGIQLFFLAFLMVATNPFAVNPTNFGVGEGINPLLLHWAMIIHPPTLFIGYAGMTVPFAYAIAALMNKDASSDWVDLAYKWTLIAWVFLSIGILLGSIWAYVVLGWGGYWGWDPVENASLLPWLGGVALIHSFHIYRQRKSFKHWALSMSVFSFLMVIIAAFITRGGIIQSVHAFERNTTVVGFFLTVLAAIIVSGVYLLSSRWQLFSSEHEFTSLFSRDIMYHINNIFMIFGASIILIGAFLPLFAGGMSIGPTVYNRIAQPLGIILLAIVAICPLIPFGKTDLTQFAKRIAAPVVVTVLAAAPLFIYWQSLNKLITAVDPKASPPGNGWLGYIGLLVAVFAAVSVIVAIVLKIQTRMKASQQGLLPAIVGYFRTQGGAAGGFIAHIGLAIVVAGLVGSTMYTASVKKTIPDKTGETISVADFTLRYKGAKSSSSSTQERFQTSFDVLNRSTGTVIGQIAPRIIFHKDKETTTSDVDIIYQPHRDIFVVLRSIDEKGAMNFEIKVNPLISFVWAGSILLVLGTVIAYWPRRKTSPQDEPVGT